MGGYISRVKALLPDVGKMDGCQLIQKSGQQVWLIHVDPYPAIHLRLFVFSLLPFLFAQPIHK